MSASRRTTGIAPALRQAEDTGLGRCLDLALFDCMLSVLGPPALDHQVSGDIPLRQGSRAPSHAPRNVYQTADGRWIAVSAGMQASAERLFAAIGQPELIHDARFSTPEGRQLHVDALNAIIGTAICSRSLDDTLRIFDVADVIAGAVLDASQLQDHDHISSRQAIVEVPDGELGQAALHAPPIRFENGEATLIASPAPEMGEHTVGIMRDILGLPAEAIDRLLADGTVHQYSRARA
jgi:crotonobetainyl-CoA:carnitine CoA-transferase CaiB-like acyl-CoA transferase